MSSRARNLAVALALAAGAVAGTVDARQPGDRRQILDAMKRATVFMVDKVSTNGGYVWSYLPDLSRRWGELEARDTMIWIQPPGTATMGHLFLDAYHATGDDYYYQAAEKAAGALIWAQHPSGGWNYLADFAGDRSLRDWYDTVGRSAWRLEEFQYYWGNATFDDAGTAESAKFLLRLYLEKRDPRYRPPLDKAIRFVIDSQYPIGAWPQRFPRPTGFARHGNADYTSYITFNDDVAAENIDFLIMCYQALGDASVLDSIVRGMNAFPVMQQGQPQPGWALQYTLDLKPAGARTYEPKGLVTHTTAVNIEALIRFYRLTGETKFLARIPEALEWLERIRLPEGTAPAGRTHATFIELGTDKPLYVHRRGSNVVNGRYYVDYDPKGTIGHYWTVYSISKAGRSVVAARRPPLNSRGGTSLSADTVHYSAFRRVNLPLLRKLYEEATAVAPSEVVKGSPLAPGAGMIPLPRFFTLTGETASQGTGTRQLLQGLTPDGYWLAPLGTNSHPYSGPGSTTVAPGDFSRSHVGDTSDTSPFPDETITGISTAAYIRNMGVLIRALEGGS